MIREITIETTERVSFQSTQNPSVWCARCARQTNRLSLEEAVALLGVDSAVLNRWVMEGKLHVETSGQGQWTVCGNSLSLIREQEDERED